MIPVQLALEVCLEALRLANGIREDMPKAAREGVWERHEKWMDRIDSLFDAVDTQMAKGKDESPNG